MLWLNTASDSKHEDYILPSEWPYAPEGRYGQPQLKVNPKGMVNYFELAF